MERDAWIAGCPSATIPDHNQAASAGSSRNIPYAAPYTKVAQARKHCICTFFGSRHEQSAFRRIAGNCEAAYAGAMLDAALKPSRIYLLRHAHSGWAMPGERDFDRRLDNRGREEAERISMTMAVNGYVPERVVCSKALRCIETWLAVDRHIRRKLDVSYTEKLYAYGHNVYVDLVAQQTGCRSLLLIGHNPMMEDTAHSLICKRLQASGGGLLNGFPTGGLAIIDLPGPLAIAGEGIGHLTAFLDPRDG